MTISMGTALDGQEVTVLTNARIVLADRVISGHVSFSGDTILAVDEDSEQATGQSLSGDYLIPGLVDIHTDHFEKHVYPRAHVRWDPFRAALAHDAQIIGSGITTVLDSLCVGATLKNPERRESLHQ
jgi:alpha-D-ribose 1-methylphosphonate 5-triphosphate diphosphatase